jgi:hypothetical protein
MLCCTSQDSVSYAILSQALKPSLVMNLTLVLFQRLASPTLQQQHERLAVSWLVALEEAVSKCTWPPVDSGLVPEALGAAVRWSGSADESGAGRTPPALMGSRAMLTPLSFTSCSCMKKAVGPRKNLLSAAVTM